jgi:hypothetical protein
LIVNAIHDDHIILGDGYISIEIYDSGIISNSHLGGSGYADFQSADQSTLRAYFKMSIQ